MSGSDLQRMMDGLFWHGIPTLFRCPHDPDPANADIGLVGVPHSTGNGTTQRDQHLGPRAVRDISALGRRVHNDFGIDPWEVCRIHDLGDVALPRANDNEACIEDITDFYREVGEAGCRPVSIGGDHSITGGILQGIAGEGARLTGGEKVCLLHFDAHTDAYHNIPHFLGAVKSAAHWAGYLVEGGHVDAEHSVQVGIRGNVRTLDWLEPSYALGYEVIRKVDYDAMGPERVMEVIDERIGDRPLYITLTSTASTRRSPPVSPTSRRASRASAWTRWCSSSARCAARTSSAATWSASCRRSTRPTTSPAIGRWP